MKNICVYFLLMTVVITLASGSYTYRKYYLYEEDNGHLITQIEEEAAQEPKEDPGNRLLKEDSEDLAKKAQKEVEKMNDKEPESVAGKEPENKGVETTTRAGRVKRQGFVIRRCAFVCRYYYYSG